MITIDGSAGEGGGQILRYACALSLITGQPMRVTGIRGGRPKPGLMRQHLTSLEAACTIGTATCEGLAVGSTEIIFHPGKIVPGEYHFAVGTAGSTGLVLQTLLMPLLLADKPSRLVLEGGTHALAAPPFDFTARTLIPILNRMGPQIDARLVRPGFYPRGGGQIEVSVTPAPLRPVSCCERGALQALSAKALYAGIPADIAAREIRCVRSQMGLDEQQTQIEELPPRPGTGKCPSAGSPVRPGDGNRRGLRAVGGSSRADRQDSRRPDAGVPHLKRRRRPLSGRSTTLAVCPGQWWQFYHC